MEKQLLEEKVYRMQAKAAEEVRRQKQEAQWLRAYVRRCVSSCSVVPDE